MVNFKTRSISYKADLSEMMGACCLSTGCQYTDANTCNQLISGEVEAGDLGSRFFHNISCENVNCQEGVCCVDGHCVKTTIVGCYARGGVWSGYDYDCDSFDCSRVTTSEIQACCFGADINAEDPPNQGYCEELIPSVCLERGGTPRGPESRCSIINAAKGCSVTGATAWGKCCASGQCHGADDIQGSPQQYGYTPGDCSAIGGVWGGSGSTCGIDKDQVGGNTFDRSWPCSYPTGSCCFGTTPFAGTIYCGSSGHTYGSCLNPPSQGGSGGSAWQIGVTCGFLNDAGPLQEISPSPTPVQDGPGVGCVLPGTLQGACCVSTTELVTIPGPYEGTEIVTDSNCYLTNDAQCTNIGGVFEVHEEGCDGVDCPEANGDSIIGCCGIKWRHPETFETTTECTPDVSINACMSLIENFYETYEEGVDYDYKQFGFADTCWSPPMDDLCGIQAPLSGACCSYFKNENGALEYFDCQTIDILPIDEWPNASYPYVICEQTLGEFYPDTVEWYWPGVYSVNSDQPACNIVECSIEQNKPGSCCVNDVCLLSFDARCRLHENGTFFANLYCQEDCGYLPCCDGFNNDVNVCINEPFSGMEWNEIQSTSHCIDKYDFNSSEFNYNTALEFILSPAGPVHNIESLTLHESPSFKCEDCEFQCTRNRGVCCWNGHPIHNTTKDECDIFGGMFGVCTGLPFTLIEEPFYGSGNSAFEYLQQEFDCSLLTDNTSNRPTNPRGTAVPRYDMQTFRRGPFSDAGGAVNGHIDICAANDEDWENNTFQNYNTLDEAFNPEFDMLPTVNAVQLFWNAPTLEGRKNSTGKTVKDGYLKPLEHANICKSINLKDCYFDMSLKGSCCVRKYKSNQSRLDDNIDKSYECVENVTQCECAVLNNVRSCSGINWIPNTKEESSCTNCPCTIIDNNMYQINSNCFTETTKVNSGSLDETLQPESEENGSY